MKNIPLSAVLLLLLAILLAGEYWTPAPPLAYSASPASPGELSIPLLNVRIVDADTIEADLALSYHTQQVELPLGVTVPSQTQLVILSKRHIRLLEVDALELSDPKGREAALALRSIADRYSGYLVLPQDKGGEGGSRERLDKYGRILGEVVFCSPGELTVRMSKWVRENGYEKP